METHETLALTTMGIFTVVLGWKLFRRARLTPPEEAGLRVLSVAGLVTGGWAGVIGGGGGVGHPAGGASRKREGGGEEPARGGPQQAGGGGGGYDGHAPPTHTQL